MTNEIIFNGTRAVSIWSDYTTTARLYVNCAGGALGDPTARVHRSKTIEAARKWAAKVLSQ